MAWAHTASGPRNSWPNSACHTGTTSTYCVALAVLLLLVLVVQYNTTWQNLKCARVGCTTTTTHYEQQRQTVQLHTSTTKINSWHYSDSTHYSSALLPPHPSHKTTGHILLAQQSSYEPNSYSVKSLYFRRSNYKGCGVGVGLTESRRHPRRHRSSSLDRRTSRCRT